MKVFLYGMKDKARDRDNYFKCDYVRDLYLEEMTCDMRDEFYSVLCYKAELDDEVLSKYGYEFISIKDIDDE